MLCLYFLWRNTEGESKSESTIVWLLTTETTQRDIVRVNIV